MVLIHLHGPLNGTDSLEVYRSLRCRHHKAYCHVCRHHTYCHRWFPSSSSMEGVAASLTTAIVISVVAVAPTPSSSASFHESFLCTLAANRRNRTKPRHSGVTHDVLMKCVPPLDVTNWGRWCEHTDINVHHDFIMSEIPRLWPYPTVALY